MKKKLTLEEKIKKIEEVARRIEDGELSITEVIDLHKESAALIKECRDELSKIENEIINVKNDD